jgi:hypothetical protein
MSNQPQQPQDKRTAAQKIDDIEKGLMYLYQTADNMARDMGTIKEAIKLLGNKLDSVVKASAAGEPLNDEVIARIMVENNVEELKQKVTNLVNQGILVASDEVGPTSFVVGRELDAEGKVANPRMQFVVNALNPEVKDKFPGAKVGSTLELQEGKWKFEIQESYNIVTPQPPAPQDNQAALQDKVEAQAAAPADAPAAPTLSAVPALPSNAPSES